jgi:hypothetical protein
VGPGPDELERYVGTTRDAGVDQDAGGRPIPAPGLSPELAVPPAITHWPQGRA